MIVHGIDNPKIRKDDRILVLKPVEGEKAKSSTGLVDPRLFNGTNRLHVIKDGTNIWSFKYDAGGLPEPLKARYTTFADAYAAAEKYLTTRNIKIVEVLD